MTAADFVSQLGAAGRPKPTSTGWQARCPAHEDGNASLSITQRDDKVLIYCHANCTTEAVVTAAGLKMTDLFTPKTATNVHAQKSRIVATYDYTDESGVLLYQAVRLDPKEFRQRRPDGNGDWIWSVKDVRPVPYRLPELIDAVAAGRPVFVVEGEKDTDAMRDAGLTATCNSGGAGKWKPEFAEQFNGATVCVIADKDDAGRRHAQQVAANLQPVASRVVVIELPDIGGTKVKDAADYLDAGGLAAGIVTLAEDAPSWTPQAPTVEPVTTEAATTDDPSKRKPLTVRRPSEILAMEFDDSDNILGDRVLAKGQYLTILGAGGLGKSRLALQLAASCITGIPFPGLESRATGMKWLFIQAENSCRRLQADLEPLRRWAGDKWADLDKNLFIHTIENDDDGFLCLANPETQDAIRFLIDATQPDVIVFDPLKDFATGDLNKDADMMDTCRAVAQLTRRGNPDRACVVLHHAITGKSGAARAVGYDRSSFGRNSKVLQAWTRAQINVAPGSADSNEVLVVSCGKLSNGKEFAPYAVRLNQETMIYELDPKFDFAAWESETTGRTVAIELTSERVASLCVGAMAKAELVKAIMDDTGVAKTKAYGSVAKAEKSKRIHFNPVLKTYVAKH